jgi:hypothetical protein
MSFEIQIGKATYVDSRVENCFHNSVSYFCQKILFGENAEQNI